VTGKIQGGYVKVEDTLIIGPEGKKTEVLNIMKFGNNLPRANTGDLVGLVLKSVTKKDLKPGQILGKNDETAPKKVLSFDAQIFVLNHPKAIKVGYSP